MLVNAEMYRILMLDDPQCFLVYLPIFLPSLPTTFPALRSLKPGSVVVLIFWLLAMVVKPVFV
jgi:hypothetical protein